MRDIGVCMATRNPIGKATKKKSTPTLAKKPVEKKSAQDKKPAPVWEPERVQQTFYLASIISEEFFLPAAHVQQAFNLAKAAIVAEGGWVRDKALRKTKNFNELFEWNCITPRHDRARNVVGFKGHGGDLWVDWMLKPCAHLVKAGSYFLVRDENGRHWKMCFEEGTVFWLREKVAFEEPKPLPLHQPQTRAIEGLAPNFCCVGFSATQLALGYAFADEGSHTVSLVSLPDLALQQTFKVPASPSSIAFSADGNSLACALESGMLYWRDLRTGIVRTFREDFIPSHTRLCFDPVGDEGIATFTTQIRGGEKTKVVRFGKERVVCSMDLPRVDCTKVIWTPEGIFAIVDCSLERWSSDLCREALYQGDLKPDSRDYLYGYLPGQGIVLKKSELLDLRTGRRTKLEMSKNDEKSAFMMYLGPQFVIAVNYDFDHNITVLVFDHSGKQLDRRSIRGDFIQEVDPLSMQLVTYDAACPIVVSLDRSRG